jgi:hypothetical protein
MDVDLAEELLNELGSSLEEMEARQNALFQFLKDQGVVTDDQFAPYLSQAGKTSGVRWRAARVRLEYLISAEKAREEKAAEKEKRGSSEEQAAAQDPDQKKEAKTGDSASPQPENEGANVADKGAGAQSDSEKDTK